MKKDGFRVFQMERGKVEGTSFKGYVKNDGVKREEEEVRDLV